MASYTKFRASYTKTLAAVEASPNRSNQHEFNGVQPLKRMFGLTKFTERAIFSIQGSDVECVANITWYDSREAHPTRSEHRLYFQSNFVMGQAEEGDNIIIGIDLDDKIHCILVRRAAAAHQGLISRWGEYQS